MENKLRKKLARAVALLRNHEPSVRTSDAPTRYLYVANSGVVCGVEFAELQLALSHLTQTFDIYAFSNKPYTFVDLYNETNAKVIYDQWQGRRPSTIGSEGTIFYLAFVENLPEVSKSLDMVPDGLLLLESFVTVDEENELLNFVRELELSQCSDANQLKRRRVFHFGYNFLYDDGNKADVNIKAAPIPEFCSKLIERFVDKRLVDKVPDQVTINVYEPGQGIPLHTDTHSAFESEILSLSLMNEISMDFVHPENGQRTSISLPTRSLLVLTGESRYIWRHGITPRKFDVKNSGKLVRRQKRVSFTFRCVRQLPCQCAFPRFCDLKHEKCEEQKMSSLTLKPSELEKKFVHEVYEDIAEHFDKTRHSQWSGVQRFLKDLPKGSLVFDVGCGNGKYLLPDDGLIKFGCDRSSGLCEICSNKKCNVVVADCLSLPSVDTFFDAVISIAVIHHLANENRRQKSISEMLRVLKVGGRALIYVWAFEQKRKGEQSFYLKSGEGSKHYEPIDQQTESTSNNGGDQNNFNLPIHDNRTEFRNQDNLVPWDLKQKNDEKRLLRFYHVFKEGDLERLCESVPNCQVVQTFYENGNWCAVIEKQDK